MERLTFTIIIPVKPGGVVRALEAVQLISYPEELCEVIVSEGCQPSFQRNSAARKAGGDILYFLDDDSMVIPDCLNILEDHYRDSRIAAVGGPSVPMPGDSLLQLAIAAALSSPLGGGGMRNRYRAAGAPRLTDDSELILCNLSFRRSVFMKMGGLDERLYPNEENELIERVIAGGGLLMHDPGLVVGRSQRPAVTALARQFLNYGRGRAEQTLISGKLRVMQFLPALFLVLVPVLAVFSFPGAVAFFMACLVLLVFVSLIEAFRRHELRFALLLPVVFPVIHLSYGAGIWRGLFSRTASKSPDEPKHDCVLRTVKGFGDSWQYPASWEPANRQ